MKRKEVNEILNCLPRDRRVFYYHKDRYAIELLRRAAARRESIRELRNSSFSALLDKPIVKSTIRHCGDGSLSVEALDATWAQQYESYRLTLDAWGSDASYWNQTSRRGCNLVLQLNFSNKHNEQYIRLIDKDEYRPFDNFGHPILKIKHYTLAWARLDVDLGSGEALIEEIQNDWLRNARRALNRNKSKQWFSHWSGVEVPLVNLQTYVLKVLKSHARIWDEAMLMATIAFLGDELGIRSIYYHTHESGAQLKRIRHSLPPRSIYESLPRRFCFRLTECRPSFLTVKSKRSRRQQVLDSARFRVLQL